MKKIVAENTPWTILTSLEFHGVSGAHFLPLTEELNCEKSTDENMSPPFFLL